MAIGFNFSGDDDSVEDIKKRNAKKLATEESSANILGHIGEVSGEEEKQNESTSILGNMARNKE